MTKVYLRGCSGQKYHIKRDCPYIQNKTVREATLDEAETWTHGACKHCSGRRNYHSVGGNLSRLERILQND